MPESTARRAGRPETASSVADRISAAGPRLTASDRKVADVVAREAAGPVGGLLADQLDQLRPGVVRLSGSPVAVARQLAGLGDNAVVVAIDLRRYERWVADGASRAAAGGADVVAVTDGPLS